MAKICFTKDIEEVDCSLGHKSGYNKNQKALESLNGGISLFSLGKQNWGETVFPL